MRRVELTHPLVYGRNDISELKSASLKVQSVYNKAAAMLCRFMPQIICDNAISRSTTAPHKNAAHSGIFQKWIQSPKGWKCVGYEWQTDMDSNVLQNCMPNTKLQIMILQMVIWSQFEKISLFHPLLDQEVFYTGEELETISLYFVPTYMSTSPLIKRGKLIKKHNVDIPIYQEYISAPSLTIELDGISLPATWMTGVYLHQELFKGISPYIQDHNGRRTFKETFINQK
ncbi:hypothetical protein [Paenibacillus crassostreae]|uniref:Uncharacterized protein n=1 Tax=Paenibacillus crassostreae TaxID=1763538 RepID=A0A162RS16_9BACL|nr:hypothetical protein [Paenibacillus crassostreae]AOZ91494.1 hypothetical protein LPB68_04230 [Paenibacillus crassostreae]OAB74347.1 hypothetical protein PNBC_09730 [Paenibacillus crassostreae]